MSMTPISRLNDLMKMGKHYGIKSLSLEGVTIEFAAQPPPSLDEIKPLTEKLGIIHGNPTEDEMLFYSSPDGPPGFEAEAPQ